MEVPRLWRNQESHYTGPGSVMFEIKSQERLLGDATIVDYTVRTKLLNKKIKFCVNGDGYQDGAERFVGGLRGRKYDDKVIFDLAFQMGSEYKKLGMGFVEQVVVAMSEDKSADAIEQKLVVLTSSVL